MSHPHTVTKVTAIPPCDFNADHGDAFADAKLPNLGPWANVCWPCFTAHGCKLGLGHGQMFVTADHVALADAAKATAIASLANDPGVTA